MRVAIATVQVPFIRGGAETLVESLRDELVARGHEAEVVTLPFRWSPPEALVDCMTMGRMLDLTESAGAKIDVVIAVKFPAYYLRHPRKVVWLCHQHRQAYDLWDTPYGDLHRLPQGDSVRQLIVNSDNQAFAEAQRVYTISANVSARLLRYNGIASTPLYHPPLHHERLHAEEYGDFVFYPSRIDAMKRQHLLVEAARHLQTNTRIVLAGGAGGPEAARLEELVRRHRLEHRVAMLGHVTEEAKLDLYARCLAVYFGAYDEDYGYVTLEALASAKPVLIHPDAGGPAEFVTDGRDGFVVPAEPEAIAASIDRLARDRSLARAMGEAGRRGLVAKGLGWDAVVSALTDWARG